MHRPPFPRTQRRTCRSRRLRPCRTLKYRLSRHRSSRRRPRRRPRGSFSRRRQRRFVNWTRPGLWHDHARRWRSGSGRLCRRRTLGLQLSDSIRRRRCRRWSSCGCCWRSRSRGPGRNRDCRRRGSDSGCRRSRRRRARGKFGRNHDHRRRTIGCRDRSRRHHSRRRWRLRRLAHWLNRDSLRWNLGFGFCGRRFERGTRGGMLNHSLLLGNRAQHVAGARDMREVDFGLDFFFAVGGARGRLGRTGRHIGAAAEMPSHQFRFVVL